MKTKIYKHFGGHSTEKINEPAVVRPRSLQKQQRQLRHLDTIDCRICGQSYKALPSHIEAKHGIKTFEYREKFGKDVPIFGADLMIDMQKLIKRINPLSSVGRKEYWNNPENRRIKSDFMKTELLRRLRNPEYYRKFRVIGVEKFKKERRKEFLEISKLRKICPNCKKEYGPKIFRREGFIRHSFSGKRWDDKIYCSRKCHFEAMKGKPKSRLHRFHLSVSKNKNPGGIFTDEGMRYPQNCIVCGKGFLVRGWQIGKTKVCSHSCAGRLNAGVAKRPKTI